MMKTLNSIACAGGIAVAMLSSSLAVAGTVEQETASQSSNASSQVHRVSHALAGASSYQGASNAGYKWGKQQVQREASGQWSESTSLQSSYKWENADSNQRPNSQHFAGGASYDWNTMSFSKQAGNKWGVRNTFDQAGNKWGVRNTFEQAGNKWGVRNTFDQAGNKWGVRNTFEQAGNKWGVRNTFEQAGNKWGVRNTFEQAGNKWGVR